jgi:hypothetical protein
LIQSLPKLKTKKMSQIFWPLVLVRYGLPMSKVC